MGTIKITLEEAFEMRTAIDKLLGSNVKYPLSFTYPLTRNLRVLNKAHKDFEKAMRCTESGQKIDQWQKERIEFLDKILKRNHVGEYIVEGEGNNQRNVYKDPETADSEIEAFNEKWAGLREIQKNYQQEITENLEKDFDGDLRPISFDIIPDNLEPEYLKPLMPLIVD